MATATENNRADDIVCSQEREPKRAFFDSADWVLHKQQASADERTLEAIESLRPKLVRTPHKQLPPRGPTFLTGQENLSFKFTDIFELLGQTGVEMESGWFGVSLLACFMFP
ncbi:hypothetical protein YC2023_031320 [Brassica napus]